MKTLKMESWNDENTKKHAYMKYGTCIYKKKEHKNMKTLKIETVIYIEIITTGIII